MTDDWLRNRLDDAVSDVEPRDALDSIRSRTKVTPMNSRRSWMYGAGGALLATAATITAFAVVNDGNGTTRDPGFVTSPPATQTPDVPPDAKSVLVPVYYLGEVSYVAGEGGQMQTAFRLYREWHSTDEASVGDVATAALERMLEPPTDGDYSSPWNPDVEVLEVVHADGVVTVDLSGPVQDVNVGSESAELAVQQLVYTVQGALAVMKEDGATDPVQLLIDGTPAGDLWGHVDASEPIARAARTGTQAPVWITEPADGATVEQPVTVTGVAQVFEGNLNWRLLQNGTEVDTGFATASEGPPAFGDYSFDLDGLAPGDYVLEVFEPSPLDGSMTYVDSKRITIE